LDVLDGIHEAGDALKLVTCRLEAAAANMAEAYGRLTGRPATVMVTRGPGACHAAVGVHIAMQDSTPMLLFVGQIKFGETDRESFQEVATAVHHQVAPNVLVFNNGMYGTIRMHQERRYPGRVVGTGLTNPDFAQLIRAYGGHGEVVDRTEAFGPAFERAIASGLPAVIELRADPWRITSRATIADLQKQAAVSE
jgi:acetolactate synthase-1/2/3 large subunit